MRQLPKPGEIYKHFKGNCYRVITVATHTETGEKLVIYQALYGDYGVYARDLATFTGPVDKEKYPYITQKKRFELVESGAVNPVTPEADGRTVSAVTSGAGGKTVSVTPEEDGRTVFVAASETGGQMASLSISNEADQTGQISENASAVKKVRLSDSDKKQSPEKEAEPQIDPMVLAYLDADTCKEKLQILTTMKDRLTDQMINTMAIAIDVEVKPGDITERYEELKYCLATRERFECRRLR